MMNSDNTEQNTRGIANYEALITAIANGEAQSVQALVADQPMHELEKNFLLDLARLNNNHTIIAILEGIAVKKQK
jgi:hypothetical protein